MLPGTATYDAGERIWTDWPFDDTGAGGFQYPDDFDRYGRNAADVAVFRMAADQRDLFVLAEMNFLATPDSTVIGVGLSDAGPKGLSEWPLGAGVDDPEVSYQAFITFSGTDGYLHDLGPDGRTRQRRLSEIGGATHANTTENLLEARVPRAALPEGTDLRVWAGAGLWDRGRQEWMPVVQSPVADEDKPTRSSGGAAPAVFNLLFRDDRESGGFQHEVQERLLTNGTIGEAGLTVDLNALIEGRTEDSAPPPCGKNITHLYRSDYRTEGVIPNSRIDYGSSELARLAQKTALGHAEKLLEPQADLAEAPIVEPGDDAVRAQLLASDATGTLYNGRFQPYVLYVPESYCEVTDVDGEPVPAPLMPLLHGWFGNHRGFNPSTNAFWEDVVEPQRALVAKLLGRGENSFYAGPGEIDVLEAMEDVKARYNIDDNRVYLSGVSMGGFGTLRVGCMYPDLFAGLIPHVPPGHEVATEVRGPSWYVDPSQAPYDMADMFENCKNLPVRSFTGTQDPLVPPIESRRLVDAMREAELDFENWEDHQGGHSDYSAPRFQEILDLMSTHKLVDNPARVRFRINPAMFTSVNPYAEHQHPGDLITHTGAYWVSEMTVRDAGNQEPGMGTTVFGDIDVTTHAVADGDHTGPFQRSQSPLLHPIADVPDPRYTRQGIVKTAAPSNTPLNKISLFTRNLSTQTLDLHRMEIDNTRTIHMEVNGDGLTTITLTAPSRWKTVQVFLDGNLVPITVHDNRLSIQADLAGQRQLSVVPGRGPRPAGKTG